MATVATDPQSLANASACYACGGDMGRQTLLMLGLLRLIALQQNPMAAVDPQSLANKAACYACSLENWQLYMLALLAIIAQQGAGGGGGGSGNIIAGDTAAPDAGDTPANTAAPALYYFTDAGGIGNQTLYQWNIAAQNWTQLI